MPDRPGTFVLKFFCVLLLCVAMYREIMQVRLSICLMGSHKTRYRHHATIRYVMLMPSVIQTVLSSNLSGWVLKASLNMKT